MHVAHHGHPAKPHPESQAHARVTLLSMDRELPLVIVAQYNPAQLQLEERASWKPSSTSKDSAPPLEYSADTPRTLSLELFFDTFEAPAGARNVKTRFVDPLTRLIRVVNPVSPDEDHRRPPLVKTVWGTGLDPFVGVLESVSTKLTMFLSDGTPVRATCAVKVMEASRYDRRTPHYVNPPPSRR